MKIRKWQSFLTDTDVIPTNKPLFSLRFLFILAVCASVIFYRFVYIYLYNVPISKYLYDYKISYTSKTYIEGFFLTAWVIFVVVLLFRISDFILNTILIPIFQIIFLGIGNILYALDFITEETFNIIKRKYKIKSSSENKDFTNNAKNTKILCERYIRQKKKVNGRTKTTLSRSQRKA